MVTLIKLVRIPTNGQSRSEKQHPIAQAKEADIETKITHITTGWITESCDDPKSFNSPAFAVRKKNDKIRVQEGAQQGPDRSRPMPNTNNRLHIQQN